MPPLTESNLEQLAIETLQSLGYRYLDPENQEAERQNLTEVILKNRLAGAIEQLNPKATSDARIQALRTILNLPSQNLIDNNEAFHRLLTEGLEIETYENGETKGQKISLVDFENHECNEFLVCNQFTVTPADARSQHTGSKRPDLVLFVNGLPLVVIELKNPADENATVQKAFTQLQNYKTAVPQLFNYNSILVASDGLDARAGSLTASFSRFLAWKTADGLKEDKTTTPQLETLIKGMLKPEVLLDLIKQFTVFEKTQREDPKTGLTLIETEKKIAAYHQYYAVNKAVQSTLRAAAPCVLEPMMLRENPASYGLPEVVSQPKGDRKAGVVWHTQGSGKSLSMVFYAGKIVLKMNNPTIVVLTDRNDLDDQLFDTFASCKQLLRQDPVQAQSRDHLKKLLKTSGGGIIFTTIQKFSPEGNENVFDELSDRENIVVIADEAHRSQYGFAAKTHLKNGEVLTKYGFAKYLRDALPNASFIGFTGTPIEKEDVSTPAVFGNYIDVYDIEQAVKDGATVRIYYESRLVKMHLKDEEMEALDREVETLETEEENSREPSAKEKAKAKWTQLEAIVGNQERLKVVAKDILEHFEKRQDVFEGKAMIVTMSRRIAVALYREMIKLKPEWHDPDRKKGALKVIMTSSSSDPGDWKMHHTTKQERHELGERLKNPDDSLKLVIVRDMWLTGFDAPCLNTMYVDKPMRGHTLMQAIARVNRVFKDKPGGLIVDYIGITSDLKKALSVYTENGGQGAPAFDQEKAVTTMLEKLEIVEQMFGSFAQPKTSAQDFDYRKYFEADTRTKMTILLEVQEFILGLPDGKNRFSKEVSLLSKAFALSVPHQRAMEIKDEVGFFQAVKARLAKFESNEGKKSDEEIESAIKQLIDKAVVAEGVIDIFDAAGIKKPDISILSDEFLEEIKDMERKNLALELLKKILGDEIKVRTKKNLIQSRRFSEMLENAMRRYQNNLLTAAQVIEELIKLAKDIKQADEEGKEFGCTDEEIAFYDALANNNSAKEVLGDKMLRDLARILVEKVKANTTIDWTIKESVQAKLRTIVKRTLRQFGYPPDQQLLATENILKQAELLADEWEGNNNV